MKKDIHPKYNENCEVKCVCGNSFKVGSTKDSLNIEVCSQCHPFYSGKERMVDTEGRVKKFQGKVAKGATMKGQVEKKKAKRALKATTKKVKK